MSQKSEKYSRDLVRRMDTLERRFSEAVTAAQTDAASVEAQARRRLVDRAREAEHSAALWRTLTLSAVVVLVLVTLLTMLSIPTRGEEGPPAPPGPPMALPPEPYIDPAPESDENAQIEAALLSRATVIEDCVVTHYCICATCCGKSPGDPAYGIAASGVRATPHVSVAVDPAVIPLGSDVLVDYGDGEIIYYRADDTGSAVHGNYIDVCTGSHEEAAALGRRTATVYWVPQG